MNLEIMKMMLDENAIQFFRGIRNRFNEKWQFTGKGSTNRKRQLVRADVRADVRVDVRADVRADVHGKTRTTLPRTVR